MTDIAKRVMDVLEKKQRTRAWLGRQCGWNKNTTHAYFNSDRMPPADRITVIADVLRISTDHLLRGDELADAILDPYVRQAAELLRDATLEEKAEAIIALKEMFGSGKQGRKRESA